MSESIKRAWSVYANAAKNGGGGYNASNGNFTGHSNVYLGGANKTHT